MKNDFESILNRFLNFDEWLHNQKAYLSEGYYKARTPQQKKLKKQILKSLALGVVESDPKFQLTQVEEMKKQLFELKRVEGPEIWSKMPKTDKHLFSQLIELIDEAKRQGLDGRLRSYMRLLTQAKRELEGD